MRVGLGSGWVLRVGDATLIQEWKNYPLQTYRDIQVFLGFYNFY
jgi:hypothetical protein